MQRESNKKIFTRPSGIFRVKNHYLPPQKSVFWAKNGQKSKKMRKNIIFFQNIFAGLEKSSTFALAKRNDTVSSLK